MTNENILITMNAISNCVAHEKQEKAIDKLKNLITKLEKDIEKDALSRQKKVINHVLKKRMSNSYKEPYKTFINDGYQYLVSEYCIIQTRNIFQVGEKAVTNEDYVKKARERFFTDKTYKRYTGEIPSIQELTDFINESKEKNVNNIRYLMGGLIPLDPSVFVLGLEFMHGEFEVKVAVRVTFTYSQYVLLIQDYNDNKFVFLSYGCDDITMKRIEELLE